MSNIAPVSAPACVGSSTSPFRTETLPITLRVVHSPEDLRRVAELRFAAYARHLAPDQVEALGKPDSADHKPATVVFLASAKDSQEPLGTMRVQTNEFEPLGVERVIDVPKWLRGKRFAEATRLGVGLGPHADLVRNALFKAYYLYCLENNVPFMVVAARRPVDKLYERLFFKDVLPGGTPVPLPYAFNLPHRVMCFDVFDAERNWRERGHPLLGFMVETRHQDIHL